MRRERDREGGEGRQGREGVKEKGRRDVTRRRVRTDTPLPSTPPPPPPPPLPTPPSILTSELQPTQLKCHKPVPNLDDVDEGVEPVRREDEEISRGDLPPPPQHEVPAQALLQYPGEVLVEEAVQAVGVRIAEVPLQLGVETCVAGVGSLGAGGQAEGRK